MGAAGAEAAGLGDDKDGEAEAKGVVSDILSEAMTVGKVAAGLAGVGVASHLGGKMIGEFGPSMEVAVAKAAKLNTMADRTLSIRTLADRALANGEISAAEHSAITNSIHEVNKAERAQFNSGATARRIAGLQKFSKAPESWANAVNKIFDNMNPGKIEFTEGFGPKEFNEYKDFITSWWHDIKEKNRIAIKNGVKGVDDLPPEPGSFHGIGAPEASGFIGSSALKNAWGALIRRTWGVFKRNLPEMEASVREYFQENSHINSKTGKIEWEPGKRPRYLDSDKVSADLASEDPKSRQIAESDVNAGNYDEWVEQESKKLPDYFVGGDAFKHDENFIDDGMSGRVLPRMGDAVHGTTTEEMLRKLERMDINASAAAEHNPATEKFLEEFGSRGFPASGSDAYKSLIDLIGKRDQHGSLLGDIYTQRGKQPETKQIWSRLTRANQALFGPSAATVLSSNPTSGVKQDVQVPLTTGAHGGIKKSGSQIKYRVKSMGASPIGRIFTGMEEQVDPNHVGYTELQPFSKNTAQQKFAATMRAESEIQDIFNPKNDARYKNYRDYLWTPEEQEILRAATENGTKPLNKAASQGLEANHVIRELETSNGSELPTSRPSFTKWNTLSRAASGFIGTPLGLDMSIIAHKGKYGSAPVKGSAGLAQAAAWLGGQHAGNLVASSSPGLKAAVLLGQGSYVPGAIALARYSNDEKSSSEINRANELAEFNSMPAYKQALIAAADFAPTKVFDANWVRDALSDKPSQTQATINKMFGYTPAGKFVSSAANPIADVASMVFPGIATPVQIGSKLINIARSDDFREGSEPWSPAIPAARFASSENPIPYLSQNLSFKFLNEQRLSYKKVNDNEELLARMAKDPQLFTPAEINEALAFKAAYSVDPKAKKPKGGSR